MSNDYKMHRYMKEQWAGCLLGGQYEQGQGQLKGEGVDQTTDVYCCLGVLAEEMGEIYDGPESDYSRKYVPESSHLNFNTEDLPIAVQCELTNMNDGDGEDGNSEGKTFAEIAEWIMENL